jgi:four helix bundle protein
MAITRFRDLEVWQVAHELTLSVYRATVTFPKQEMFGLTSQLRRSAASIPANIAEGGARRSTKDYLRHLAIANGSLAESKYFLLLARDLSYVNGETYSELEKLTNRIGAMIVSLERALRKRLAPQGQTADQIAPSREALEPANCKNDNP